MATNNDGLFPTGNVYGLPDQSGGLFDAPRVAGLTTPTPRAPTQKQLLEQQAAQAEARVQGVITSLRNQPEWVNGTAIKKQELLNSWLTNQWAPIKAQIADPIEAANLEATITGALKQDISAQNKRASEGRLADTVSGAIASTGSIVNQLVNQAPAAYQQSEIDNLTSQIQRYQQTLATGAAEYINPQTGFPQSRELLEQELNILLSRRADSIKSRDSSLQDASRYQKTIDKIRQDRSYGQTQRDLRIQELKQAGSDTPMASAVFEGSVGDVLANIGQYAGENAPSALVSIGAAGLGQAAGIPAPLTLATVGGALGAGDAGDNAFSDIMNLTEEELAKSPEYKKLLDDGNTPKQARDILAARGYSVAAPYGAATGALLNLIGPEAIITRGLPSSVRSAISGVAARTGAPRVATAVGTAAVGAASEYPDEYLQQVAGNYGVQQATGVKRDLTEGAHDAGLIGIVAGGPLSVASGVSEARRSPTPSQIVAPDNTQASAAEATQTSRRQRAEGTTQVPESFTPTTNRNSTQETNAQTLGDPVDTFANTTVSLLTEENAGPLTQDQVDGVLAQARQAEIAGVSDAAITQSLTNLQMTRGLQTTQPGSIVEQYVSLKETTPITEAEVIQETTKQAAPLGEAIATAVETNTINEVVQNEGIIDPGTSTADISGLDINSRMEAFAAEIDNTFTTVSNENTTEAGGAVASTGVGRVQESQQSANVSNQESNAAVGIDTGQPATIGRPDNQSISGVGTQNSSGTRVPGSTAVQRTDSGGSTTGVGRGETGRDAVESYMQPVEAESVSITPAGYDIESLANKTDILMESETASLYALDAAQLSDALVRGDYETADRIAGALYAEGLRQFAPPQENVGRGGEALDAAHNNLSAPERLGLQREYELQRTANNLTPDMDSYKSFVGGLVQSELEVQAGNSALSTVYNKISDAVRNTIRKLAMALQAIVFAVAVNQAVVPSDAMAARGYSTVSTPVQTEQLQALSPQANLVNAWVKQSKDNNGQRYIIADKVAGTIHIMDATGKELATAPALYGKKEGDGMTLGETPAGIFLLQQRSAPKSYGGDIQQFGTAPDGDVYAIHRVLTTNPKQNRLGRLATPTAADNRISLGCINIPTEIYNQFLNTGFQGKLYIMPDQKALGDVFTGLVEEQSRTDLMDGQTLPQELNNSTATQFQSSTSNRAETNLDSAGTIAAADIGLQNTIVAEQSTNSSDSLLLAGLFAGVIRRRNNKYNAPIGEAMDSTQTPEPGPSLGDVSTATDEIADSTSGMTEPPAQPPRAPRQYTEAQRADLLRTAAFKTRAAYADAATPLLEWLHTKAERVANAEYDTHPVWQNWTLLLGKRDATAQELKREYFDPFISHIARVANRTKQGADAVARDIATWTTAYHIMAEASAAHRRKLQQRVVEATQLPAQEVAEAVATAQEALRAYDAFQDGTGPRVPVPGGMSIAEAQNTMLYIESLGYSQEDLRTGQEQLVRAAQAATEARLEAGTLLPEEVTAWSDNEFQFYVPLYVDHSYDGVFLGGSTYNPGGDFQREGTLRRDDLLNAAEAVTQYMNKSAAEIASTEFKTQLNELYLRLEQSGDTKGLNRYNLATNPEMVSREAREARGFIYTEKNVQPDGSVKVSRYKLWFDDNRITNALLGQMTILHGLDVDAGQWVKNKVAGVTRLYSRYITQYDPAFAPTNMIKDFMERNANLIARDIPDVNGKIVSGGTLARQATAHGMNPKLVKDIALALINNDTSSYYGRYFKELEQAGGISTLQNLLSKDTNALVREFKKTQGFRKLGANASKAIMYYNEAFNLAPLVASYTAMRENNIGIEDAAFRNLDLMNYRKQGSYVQSLNLTVLYPFVKPVFQSGANIVRTLGFSPGQDNWASPTPAARRGRIAMAGMFAASTILYSIASAIGGDDDDVGNRVDALPMSQISRFVPLYYGNDGDRYIKLPVGYGLPQIAWISAIALDRARRGILSYGDAATEIALAFAKNMSPDTAPEFSFKEHPLEWLAIALSPSVIAGEVQVAVNLNTFGNQITYGSRTLGTRKADSGRARTPDVWEKVAGNIQDVTGIDFFPEQIRHLINSHAIGPIRGALTYLESEDNYKAAAGLSTAQEQGWLASTIGLQKWWGTDYAIASRMYYSRVQKIEKLLNDNNIETTSPDNRGNPGAKERMIVQQLLVAGVDTAQINDVVRYLDTKKKIEANNKKLRETVRATKKVDLDSEVLRPVFEASGKEQDAIMRQFLRTSTGEWL